MTCPEVCCDVCEKQASEYQDRYPELAILIQVIDEPGNLGEVKIAEWIRGGQMAWMKTKQGSGDTSAYGKVHLDFHEIGGGPLFFRLPQEGTYMYH